MKRISILIPTYNTDCTALVEALCTQADDLNMEYEVIVADDASPDRNAVAPNESINTLPHCKLMTLTDNIGRAAIRNFLAKETQYEWLLFIDSDMVMCRKDFLRRYVESDGASVYDGGITVGKYVKGNLRSMYEKAAEQQHTAEKRKQTPYQHFHTANFMVSKDIMLQHPFDERFRRYGYEDVLFGKQLKEHGIAICHLDNPLSFEIFETNEHFVAKTEEGLRTLFQFRHELQGYSGLLDIASKIAPAAPLLRLWHRICGRWERQLLTGSHPSLAIFKLYRLGYFVSLKPTCC